MRCRQCNESPRRKTKKKKKERPRKLGKGKSRKGRMSNSLRGSAAKGGKGKDTQQVVRNCEAGEARQSKGMAKNRKEMQDWLGKANHPFYYGRGRQGNEAETHCYT